MNKVAGLARAVAILLAIVAGFVAIPTNVPLVLLLLGVIAGLGYTNDDFMRTVLLAVALPIAGAGLALIPTVGAQLQAVMGNLAGAVAGVLAARIIIRLYETVVGDIKGLTG